MNTKKSRGFKCFKCFVIFYLILSCVLGMCISVFAGWLLLFRQGARISKARNITLCFLIVPALLSIVCTALGWSAINRKRKKLIKAFAVLLAVTDTILIAGCLWAFISIPQIKEQTLEYMDKQFFNMVSDPKSANWWNDIQSMFKCCGIHGPTDYFSVKSVPLSCCGFDPEDKTKGSCSFIWQNGCSHSLTSQVSNDIILLGVIGFVTAFLQIPGIFITWCFAKKISQDSI